MHDEMSFSRLTEYLDTADRSACVPCRVAVLRNVVLEPIEPYLRYRLLRAGIDAELAFGEYDNVMQEALEDGPLDGGADVVLVAEHLELLAPRLYRAFPELSAEEVGARCEEVLDHARAVLGALRGRTSAPVVWIGFETPAHPAMGVLDAQGGHSQADAVRELNRGLRALLAEAGNAFFLDMDQCLARVGMDAFYDRRWWYRARAPYARSGLAAIAHEVARLVCAVRGRVRKCLVLDCDGVLWGGVVGEDGVEGIHLGPEHPGASYMDFQREALNLARRGVVLALCSKNNEADVWEVFDTHPGMVLSKEDIAAWRIDWNDKAANITALAEELNLGLDSFVFVDDSAFETELVRGALPEVEVLHLPKECAADARDVLAGCGLFDALTFSAEDRNRGGMYRAEAGRRKLRAGITDMDTYLRSLEIRLTVRRADEWNIPRIAQLTQKTNQFNLTTRRYTEDHIRAFAASGHHEVVCVSLTDRFGDMGIIGAAIAELDAEGAAVLDTFLLSCRAIGRGVERALLAEVLARVAARGAARAVGVYRPTRKNAQVRNFYPDNGFTAGGGAPDGEARHELVLADGLPQVPGHFAAVDSEQHDGIWESA